MPRHKIFTAIALTLLTACTAWAQITWYSPLDNCDGDPYICGRAWNRENPLNYQRIPERFNGKVTPAVWSLSKNSAGLSLRFVTNSKTIRVKYILAFQPAYRNMTWLNQAGVDLYGADAKGKLHWIGNHMQWKVSGDTATITLGELTYPQECKDGTEFRLYLPPYSVVTSVNIGVDDGSMFRYLHEKNAKPIVVYGTSIIHGASPSRPGLMITNIVARESGWPVVNLGFSGSAFMEPAIFDMLSEIDARAFIIDPIPNSYNLGDEIVIRACNGVRKLRETSSAPILLVESSVPMDTLFLGPRCQKYVNGNKRLREAYDKLVSEGIQNLYYLPAEDLHFTEESMIEGAHPNDFGNKEYADAYVKKISEMFNGKQARTVTKHPKKRRR